jgi:hypothetical protein
MSSKNQDKVIKEIRVLRYETRHDVDDGSTSTNAESTGRWERTQENKRGEKKRHTVRLISRKRCSNAVLNEEACLNTFESLRFVMESGGKRNGVGGE